MPAKKKKAGSPEEDASPEDTDVEGEEGEEAAAGEVGEVEKEKQEQEEEGEKQEQEEEEAEDPELVKLKDEIKRAEADVVLARKRLSSANDKLLEAGKLGYARVAAKVQDYKKRAADGKKEERGRALLSVAKSFTDVMEAFEAAPELIPGDAGTEDGDAVAKVHSAYQALFREMALKFEKLGLEPFSATVGMAFDASLHTVAEGGDAASILEKHGAGAIPGTVVFEVKNGLRMPAGLVRKALVVVSPVAAAEPPADQEPDAEEATASEDAE